MPSKIKYLSILLWAISSLFLTSCGFLNQSPVAVISASTTSGETPLDVDFSGAGSYDPDGEITKYRWDFGDGNTSSGIIASHTYQDDGIYSVQLIVTDASSATGSDSVDINVTNPAPVADFSFQPINPAVGEEVTFSASDSYDLANLTLSASITSFEWDFGDGETDSGMIVYHPYSRAGVFEVRLSIADDDGAISTLAREITVGSDGEYYRPIFYWTWNGTDWSWQIQIAAYLYEYFNTKPRSQCFPLPNNCNYADFVLNSEDDNIMESLAAELSAGVTDHYNKLENALYFAQAGIRYDYWESPLVSESFECSNCPTPITQRVECDEMCYTDSSTGQVECGCEWPRYPIETLATGYGDCEDTAILFASLIRTFGYGARLAEVPGHMAGLAPVDSSWVEENRNWLEDQCWQHGWYFNAFTDSTNSDIIWLWAETAVDSTYIPLGCYTERLNLIDSWNVSSESWVKLEAVG